MPKCDCNMGDTQKCDVSLCDSGLHVILQSDEGGCQVEVSPSALIYALTLFGADFSKKGVSPDHDNE